MYNSSSYYSSSGGLDSQRQRSYYNESSQFSPGDPGGFVLPTAMNGADSGNSSNCCPAPMGFVLPNVAVQHQQVWSPQYPTSQPMSGYTSQSSPSPPQQYRQAPMMYQPPSGYQQQQQYSQQQYQQPQQQQQQYPSRIGQPPSYGPVDVDPTPIGPSPSRYNPNRSRESTMMMQTQEVGARSVYSPSYGSHEFYPQQQHQHQQQHPAYSWEDLRYNNY